MLASPTMPAGHDVPDEPTVVLGRVPYRDAWDLQRRVHDERKAGLRGDTLLLLEHDPVITFGRSGGEEFLRSAGPLHHRAVGPIELVKSDRGGKITYHGPGQLVGYGIVSLAERKLFPATYVHRMEAVLIEALARLGLTARAEPGRVGVWIADRKIASIGVRVVDGVALHGFALNVENDLAPFALMHPCGLMDVRMTSTRAEGIGASFGDVREVVARAWCERFPPRVGESEPRGDS